MFMENEEEDKIIVLRRFDSSFDANIAKTKLDAYGIPCFLTDENLASLYPLPNLTAMQVRLHVFEKDKAQAELILQEEPQ